MLIYFYLNNNIDIMTLAISINSYMLSIYSGKNFIYIYIYKTYFIYNYI